MPTDDHQVLLMSIRAYLGEVVRPFEEDLRRDESAIVDVTRAVMRVIALVEDGDLSPLEAARKIRPFIEEAYRGFGR